MNILPRLFALVGLGLFAAQICASTPHRHAIDPVIALSASAPSRDRIEIHWTIAAGYSLSHRSLAVKITQGFEATSALSVTAPIRRSGDGDRAKTVSHSVIATQAGTAAADAQQLAVRVQYQVCAVTGHCSPKQSRELTVQLPAAVSPPPSLLRLPPKSIQPVGLANTTAMLGSATLPLPAEQAFNFSAIVDDGNHLLMRFTPQPGYYIYRDRISFAIEGAVGISPGLPQWPPGVMHRDEHFGNVIVYFDQAEVRLPLVRQRSEATNITLVTTLQGCQNNGICYPPMTRRVRLALPVGVVASIDQAIASPLVITSPRDDHSNAAKPAEPTQSENPPDQATDGAKSPESVRSSALKDNHAFTALLNALFLAFVGGLTLNFLPCVLPVLSLKVLRLAQQGYDPRKARLQANGYTAGVLCSFCIIGGLAIGLRAAGQAIGWGFQLQQPHFVGFLAYLMFGIGLSLSGVFTLDSRFSKLGTALASKRGILGDFFSGALACVVASPCIAPFMGSALVYAFTAPPLLAFLVFMMLGLGLALPFLIIGYNPSLAKRLPQPGQWMETLKQLLAFPMYLSAVWLLHVLGDQRGAEAIALVLTGMTVFALGLWWFDKSRWRSHRHGMIWGALVTVFALSPLWHLSSLPSNDSVESGSSRITRDTLPYSQQLLERLRADNRVVFVNITAAWCVTCSVNERTVLRTQAFLQSLRDVDGVYLKGDWTNPDPHLEAFLQTHHAVGVPLYVVYGPGSPPTVLPTLLSHAVVEDALRRAAR